MCNGVYKKGYMVLPFESRDRSSRTEEQVDFLEEEPEQSYFGRTIDMIFGWRKFEQRANLSAGNFFNCLYIFPVKTCVRIKTLPRRIRRKFDRAIQHCFNID